MDVNEYGKESIMCMSCGCGKPNDNHGDSRNITLHDLNDAAEAAGISTAQAVQNIMNASQQVSERSAGTSVERENYGQTQGFVQPSH
jgi:hypothetical protein